MRDYSQAKIYHIVCNITGETYYGSTVQKISQRMGGHRRPDNECCSKPIIERGDYYYGLVEDYKCDNLEQLLMRERYYVDNNDCINNRSPIRTKEEEIAYMKVYNKIYRQEHKEELSAQKKVYLAMNSETYRAKKKVYREANKDKRKEWATKKVLCECGCELMRGSLTGHRKTKFHQEFIQSLASGGNTIY